MATKFLAFTVSGFALAFALGSPAAAQDSAPAGSATSPDSGDTAPSGQDATTAAPGGEIVVTGIRASLRSAQAIKQNKIEVVDSIVAEDIGKLPDVNTTEALQRISGIQVSRDRGEGGTVAIRGLSQVQTTLNGREIFTAGGGRSFNLQDFPAELLAGIDVYKTPSAYLVEGGIGGLIDLRTRRPLDFNGFFLSGSGLMRWNDLIDKWSPQVSALVSNRWSVGDGDFGVLVSGVYQERDFRTDIMSVGNPLVRTDLAAGRTILIRNGTFEPLVDGVRKRTGLDGMLQWRPTPDLELYAQASYQKFESKTQQRGINNAINIQGASGAIPRAPVTAFTTFEGTNNVSTMTLQNVVVRTFAAARDTKDENQQYAVGGRFRTGAATFSTDLTYQKSTNDLLYTELDLDTTVPSAAYDFRGKVASVAFTGTDLNNLANFRFGPLTRSENHFTGDMYAGRVDGEFEVDSGFMKSFRAGLRYTRRTIEFLPIRFFSNPPAGAVPSAFSNLFVPMPINDFFAGENVNRSFLVADTDPLREDWNAVRTRLGITTPAAVDQRGVYDITENTKTLYAMVTFATEGGLPIDGNVGMRVVQTRSNIVGNQPVFVNNVQTGIAPINLSSTYTSALPSANLRVRLTDQLQARFAAAKTLTRPDFSQLAPTLTLVPAQQAGSGGNPGLRPLRADQLDASLEYYPTSTSSVYVAGFYRKVKDFIFTQSVQGVEIGGITYTLTRPENLQQGTIKGLEVGGQTFFDFLPGPFDGLGIQANYTFVKSDTPSTVAGSFVRTPLPNLSKHSYNLVGLYEKGPISARVAYNWRSKFFSSLFAAAGLQPTPVYRKQYGWLDASINFDITDQITLTAQGQNLLRTPTDTYYGDRTLRANYEIDDRQFLVGARFKL